MSKIFYLLVIMISTGFFVSTDGADSDKLTKQDSDKSKSEMGNDLDELNKELKPESVPEEVDVLGLLKQVQEKMTEAADGLSKASVWKAIEKQKQVPSDINEVIKRQKEALEQLNKSLQDTKKKQQEAIDNINKLIKAARQVQQQDQSRSNPDKQKPQAKPKEQPKQKPGEPATQPYEATAQPPGAGRHTSGTSDRWGNLPPKLREAIILSKPEEFTMEYQQWLERYFKILAEEYK